MRLAVYNVENLFDRPKAMNLGTWKEGKPILQDFAALSQLLGEVSYTAARKKRMAELMIRLGLEKDDDAPFVLLRRNRGQLLRRPKTGGIEIVAEGRADWAGSLELQDEPVDEVAMRNTARVIHDGGHPGTYGLCNAGNKIDYILLSPKLFQRVKAGGVMRQGMWPGVKPKRWETYDDLDDPKNAASDHAALWVDLDL